MILLTDGSLLVHNGYLQGAPIANASQWLRLTPDQNGAYESGSWSSEISMQFGRQWFASGVLADGRVFCIGGEDCSDPANPNDAPTGELFDPLTNSWSSIAKPAAFNYVAGDCNGSVLADGRVLLGAANSTAYPQTKRTAIWDPTDNSWVEAGLEFGAVGTTTKSDPFEEETWALLPDGSVLAPAVVNTPQAQRYVPALDEWVDCTPSPVNLAVTSINGTQVEETGGVVLLPSGAAFAIGGGGQTATFTLGPNPTDPGSWTLGPSFPTDTTANPNWPTLTALDAPACLLPSGKVVLLAGNAELTDGFFFFSSFPVVLEYDPSSNASILPQLDVQPTFPTGNQTWQSAFMLLPTGQLLLSAQSNTLFLYTPDSTSGAPDPSWAPANISVPSTLVLSHSYTLSGTQLNGLSQAVTYGDDAGMATNYPIVRLTNPSTGQVVYVRSYNFSSMGVATGTTVPDDLQTCTIDIPANLATGTWNLEVIANGISSSSVAVQIVAQDCFFIVDNSTFSVGEIDSYVKASPPTNAVFNPAFYVVVEGYTPVEIGIDTTMPIPPQLLHPPILPAVPSPFSDMLIAFAGPMIPEDPNLPANPQRFTFPFSITFVDDKMFTAVTTPVTLTAKFSAASNTVSNTATITLIANPNPYILHGDSTEQWYLSQDIRVFQVIAGNTLFGATIATSGTAQQIATTYIQDAVTNLRTDTTGTVRAQFDDIPQDEDSEVLQLLPNDPATGNPVYNFAIARVRLRDTQNASNVRVFFRVWRAQQTNATYNSTTYARGINAEGQPIPVLGVDGDEIITIPFFAEARQTTAEQLHLQTDDFNRHDIDASSGETDYFFGCWMDVNQPGDLRYPQRINGNADGPFNTISPLFPIQQFMVAAHQCLIVEIAYDPDPIVSPADPSTSDKLAQRNLAFVGAPNPGNPASRRVPQTFEVKPTALQQGVGVKPDELMIEWENIPKGSFAEVYLPAVSADSILTTANALYTSHLLKRADAHTLRFPAAGATYIPIPPGASMTYAALLTLDLPAGIHKGETYAAIVRQVTAVAARGQNDNIKTVGSAAADIAYDIHYWRRTTGIFKLTIPVSTKALLLEPEEQYLSVMKWVNEAIPATSRWYLIMQRYLRQIAGRVTYMGGDPTQVIASGTGTWKTPTPIGPTEISFEGKVESLIFDRFGDFMSFTLMTSGGEIKRFESREKHVEELARRALQDRFRVLVIVKSDKVHLPESIVLLA
jgi:hypothetical protein